jgi:predicted transcriptional regulator
MPREDLLTLSAQIVSAHLKHNRVATHEVPALIQSVYSALDQIEAPVAEAVRQEPAVPIKKSVFPDYIVCLEDGKKLKMLKRHLQTSYGMTPEDYRAKWGLPKDYPMVAPAYASHRSDLAKSIGLGRKPSDSAEPQAPAAEHAVETIDGVPIQKIPAAKRGRKRVEAKGEETAE